MHTLCRHITLHAAWFLLQEYHSAAGRAGGSEQQVAQQAALALTHGACALYNSSTLQQLTCCRNIGVPAGRTGGGNEQQAAQQAAQALAQMARAPGPSLAEVLKPEVIIPLLQVGVSGSFVPKPLSFSLRYQTKAEGQCFHICRSLVDVMVCIQPW